MSSQRTQPIGAVERSFAILDTLKELNGGGVTEVAEQLDIPKSTAHSHLATLERIGCVRNEDEAYRIGLKFLELGGYAREQMKLYRVARPEVENLADTTGEWSNLLVEDNGRGVYVHVERGEHAVELDVYEGRRPYLHSTALGKAILAYKSDEEVRDILEKHGMPQLTPRTVETEEELFDRLEQVRDRGCAFDREERLQGLKCVAAPIVVESEDTVYGAVSVSGPTSRMKGERFETEIPELVTSAANVISINLTYS